MPFRTIARCQLVHRCGRITIGTETPPAPPGSTRVNQGSLPQNQKPCIPQPHLRQP
nr:MAG TPA_asm: hypothetical protein [Caudoviricetes sp.]